MISNRKGFTLIELSIVLVIIGLIVGGVMVGRYLIETATINRQIAQIQQFNLSVNNFRLKYNAIPGDITARQAQGYGFVTRAGTTGRGDGNTYIGSCSGASTWATRSNGYFGCEAALFWNDLYTAGLTTENFSLDTDTTLQVAAGQLHNYIPIAKLGTGNFITVFNNPDSGAPWCNANICLSISNIVSTAASGQYNMWAYAGGNYGVNVGWAYAIDTKLDDGIPYTGKVIGGRDNLSVISVYNPSGANNCTTNASGTYLYNTSSTYFNSPECMVNIILR